MPVGLRDGHPLLAVFANSAWDTAVLDRDVAFENMFAWLEAIVAEARRHPAVDVVIRAHPAERSEIGRAHV